MMNHAGEPRFLQSLQGRLLKVTVEITGDQRTRKIGDLRQFFKPICKGMSRFCATRGIAPLAIIPVAIGPRCTLAGL